MAELIRNYPIKSRNVISHIRKATQGAVALENCHPFVRELWGRYWVFAATSSTSMNIADTSKLVWSKIS